MALYLSNKCLSMTPTMGNTTHRFSKHIFLAVVLASLACLTTSAPLTSDSDGSQKQSSSSSFSTSSSEASLASPSTSAASSLSYPMNENIGSISHLVKRSAPAPYSGHSIMRFGRAAHSIMHFGKRSNEQLDENVANEPLLSNETPEVDDDIVDVASLKQFPLITDGFNRFILLPVSGNRLYSNNKRAVSKFQDEMPVSGRRDNVFMHFG